MSSLNSHKAHLLIAGWRHWAGATTMLIGLHMLVALPAQGQEVTKPNSPLTIATTTISGVVYTTHGTPARKVTVTLWSDSLVATSLVTKTNARGKFCFAVASDSVVFFSSICAVRRPPKRYDRYATEACADLVSSNVQPYLLRLERHKIPRFR